MFKQTVVARVTSVQVYYVYADQIATPRVITRVTDNQIVWRWDMTDPFGLIQPDANPSGLGVFAYNPRFPRYPVWRLLHSQRRQLSNEPR